MDADLSLHQTDFRAHERTFQLLVQVSGRAGRGDTAGEVFVQTYTPHASADPVSRKKPTSDGFLDAELAQRKEYHYPPSRRLIRHLFRGHNAEKVKFYAEQWAKRAEIVLKDAAELRGPAPPPLDKIKGFYRYQLWYFVDSIGRIAPLLRQLQQDEFPQTRKSCRQLTWTRWI